MNRTSCWSIAAAALALAVTPVPAPAQSVDQVITAQQQRTRLAQESQERIDQIVENTRRAEEQYNRVLREIEGLEVYNTLLQRQVDNQEAERQDLAESLEQVDMINRQIVPLMTRMIAGLEQFVELDAPFLLAERQRRVRDLNALLERQDVTVAEKFRRVTEAFQIEMDYGQTIETYKQTMDIDGGTREVDMLRIGRVVLIYQTADGSRAGVWNQTERRWDPVGNEFRRDIRLALQMARQQIAPELVTLPVAAPTAVEAR
ncbi:MAG: DUF3450 domain-containing protein [Chromatiales bacterium]|nr:DUF3450 domain-containing protein [Chromatiales bacterium]